MEPRVSVFGCAIAFCSLVLLYASFSLQQQPNLGHLYTNCLRNASAPLPAAFTATLNSTLRNFTSLAAQGSTYANTSSSDGLYAMFQCRGDMDPLSCRDCMRNATARLPIACPLSVGARVRLDGCFLRYDNQSFFSLDTTFLLGFCYAPTTDTVALTAIADMMQQVTTEAPKSRSLFASATERDVHAMAECWRYLDESECSQCLGTHPYRTLCDSTLGVQMHSASCDYRYEPYVFLNDIPSPTPSPAESVKGSPPPPAQATSSKSSSGQKKKWMVAVIIVVALLAAFGAICMALVWRRRTSKIKGVKRVEKAESFKLQLTKARLFSLEELEEATAHFHPTNKLGEGGFGIVYKGRLLNEDVVAIKRLHGGSRRGKQDFLNEVNAITNVQHKNLIRLLGCCVEGSERMLVYEYLANKSLDCFLSGRSIRKLTWSNRYGIILGMAKGLGYLHEESQIRIIHRDIKPSNILLDDQLNPVIADFGLARLIQDDETHVNTGVAGTLGYLSPEYAIRGELSEKVDVYSFGLVALEIITGKQNVPIELLTWVWHTYQQGNVLNLADDRMGGIFSPVQLSRIVHVALLCIQENPKLRPGMSTVILWLSGMSDILEKPIKPAFLDYMDAAPSMSELDQHVITTSSSSSRSTKQLNPVSQGVLSFSEIVEPR